MSVCELKRKFPSLIFWLDLWKNLKIMAREKL